jgi:hypothetical protein
MQRLLIWVAGMVMLTACNQTGQKEEAGFISGSKEEIVTATVEEILSQPAEYDGKQIAISGMVTHVCRHGGQKCFVLGEDGETQIRIVPGGDIDEFKIDMEGSTVAFLGTFKVLNAQQATALLEDHESQAHHDQEMAHSEAEKADYFIEATDFKEVTP